jgi:hypothetical protein
MRSPGCNLADRRDRNRLAKVGDRVTVTAQHAPDVRTGVITHIEPRGVTVRHDYMDVNTHGLNWCWDEFDLEPEVLVPDRCSPPDGPAGAGHAL